MNTDDVRVMLTLLKSIDDSLRKLIKRKPKKNKHKPPAPTYMDK